MKSVVGVFVSPADASRAVAGLRDVGLSADHVSMLNPGASPEKLAQVATMDTEAPGPGTAIGGAVGAAVGASAGITTLLIPGIGPVAGIGLAAAGFLAGVLGGTALGSELESRLDEGLPVDEFYLYEDALRQGRSVVIALARDETQAEAAREVLRRQDAETLDQARERWWLGLRAAEKAHYDAAGRDFGTDERAFRAGFEAAQDPRLGTRAYDEVKDELRQAYPKLFDQAAFRWGFDRGGENVRERRTRG